MRSQRASSSSEQRRAGNVAGLIRCRRRSPRATRPRSVPSLTDWVLIADLYAELAGMIGSPVVELNRAVAVGMAYGPAAGLELVESLVASGSLSGYHLLPATRADLLRRMGRSHEAKEAYEQALELTSTVAERRYLERRLEEVSGTKARRAGPRRRSLTVARRGVARLTVSGMHHRYFVADVFTDTPLEGNQVAVFTEAQSIPEALMQAVAR